MYRVNPVVLTLALFVIVICSCTKIEKKENVVNNQVGSSLNQPVYKNPFGVLISKSNGISLGDADAVQLAKDLGVQYVRLSLESGNWDDSLKRRSFLNTYKSFVTATPAIQVLLNINWRNAKGSVPFPGASPEYKTYITNVLDTLMSGRYAAPALVVVENEENNPNFHAIATKGDLDKYLDELKYAVQVCKARNIKVCNAGFTSLGMHLLVWDYYKNILQDSIAAQTFMHEILPPESTVDFNTSKFQKKLKIVKYLMDAYPTVDMDYFNFHWYEPVQALFWLDSTLPHSIDTNNISQGALEDVVNYLRYHAPIAGKTIITNETGQITTSPEIPKEITCALQAFPIVSWYSGDGGFDDDRKALYKAVALHNAKRTTPVYTLRPNGVAFKTNIANIIADPYDYCQSFFK
ncbi:hypothetical protein FRZ67_19825 [Panacibacter ginsenosidivorans]|uniref:Arabinogalactan endo-beta-1,4-galactanase n=1 Tax=Panacibacter ginsenosidivorans TaxID=1813871 RepID=A0A5B8VEN7_9BACT|nr:hypothetical protein [Panacibacter ginsenosidivorans]QEC69441.1 hypothetical protein FRZ67_19825 [Panacibacter ginsenosidivorans]